MAKNRNKKKRNGAASMDVSEGPVPDLPQAMDTSETGVSKPDCGAGKIKMKKGRPMKKSQNVRKMKAVAKAIATNEKYAEKTSKSETKKCRTQLDKLLYD